MSNIKTREMGLLERVKAHVAGKSAEELRAEFDRITESDLKDGISIKVFLENNGYKISEGCREYEPSEYYELNLKALLQTGLSFFIYLNQKTICI